MVGVDDSEAAEAALEYALDAAAAQGTAVRVVSVFGLVEDWPLPFTRRSSSSVAEATGLIERRLRDLVGELVAARPRLAGVPVDVQALLGAPAGVLVEQAARADLLVIGHRGRGALASALLGSVGLHCVLHAPCTVTVVRTIAVQARERARAARLALTPAPIGPALA